MATKTEEPFDKILSKLETMTARMDALETGAGSKNPLKKSDGELPPQFQKDTKKDEDEDEEKKEDKKDAKKDGEEDEDKEKADAKKDGDLDIKHEGGDKTNLELTKPDKKKDALPPQFAKKDGEMPPQFKKDGEEGEGKIPPVADKKSDEGDKRAIADSISGLEKLVREQNRQIEALRAQAAKPRQVSDEEYIARGDVQARADAIFQGFGKIAPRLGEGEDINTYRRRVAIKLKPHSTQWKDVKLSTLSDEAFNVAEKQIYNDAIAAAEHPTDLGEGELREVNKVDPRTGLHTTVFYGEHFIKGMTRPGRKVRSFVTRPSV